MDRRTFLGSAALAMMGGCVTRGASVRPAQIALADFAVAVPGIDQPEGLATTPDGRLFLSSMKAALTVRETDGSLRQIGTPLAPTGIAVDRQGRAIVANMGLLNKGPGPLQRVDAAAGTVETLVAELEGRALVASNGPVVARDGTIYCSHTSWGPIANIGTTDPAGFIYRVAPDGRADIVARQLRGVNGLCLDRGDRHLYASLTAEGRIVRFRRLADGSLGPREDYGPVLGQVVPNHMARDILRIPSAERGALGYCDGIAFDGAGNLWVTLPFANRLVAIAPDGALVDVVHDLEAVRIATPTNLCWGGPDRRTLYVVCRGAGTIISVRTQAAGMPMANWPA
jgi:gluconolactonase